MSGERPPELAVTVSRHPRASAQIRRWRAWAGIGGLVLVGVLAGRAGLPPADAWLRALAGGVIAYFAAWGVLVLVWRQLIVAEIRAVAQRALDERKAALDAAAKQAKGSEA
jgi:uncharacterized membrane protein YccC